MSSPQNCHREQLALRRRPTSYELYTAVSTDCCKILRTEHKRISFVLRVIFTWVRLYATFLTLLPPFYLRLLVSETHETYNLRQPVKWKIKPPQAWLKPRERAIRRHFLILDLGEGWSFVSSEIINFKERRSADLSSTRNRANLLTGASFWNTSDGFRPSIR